MRKLSCKDAGMQGCSFEATGQDDDEVMAKGKEHVRAVHQHDLTPERGVEDPLDHPRTPDAIYFFLAGAARRARRCVRRFFLRSVLRLRPRISAALSWLSPVCSSTSSNSGRSTREIDLVVEVVHRVAVDPRKQPADLGLAPSPRTTSCSTGTRSATAGSTSSTSPGSTWPRRRARQSRRTTSRSSATLPGHG